MTIDAWLKQSTNELADNLFESPLLDTEIILAHTVGHPRTWLHAHGNEKLEPRHVEIANSRLDLRLDRVPIAYIIGHKEFYGRQFAVDPSVLIPRPESEQLIDMLAQLLPELHNSTAASAKRLVDIGTGSGCLGITAKLEFSTLTVDLVDTSRSALKVAKKNALSLEANVNTLLSDLLTDYPFNPDVVVANLPYVDPSWEQSPELAHEPSEALFADKNGLSLIERCIDQASHRLQPGSIVLLEADTRQLDDIATLASEDFTEVARNTFSVALKKR